MHGFPNNTRAGLSQAHVVQDGILHYMHYLLA